MNAAARRSVSLGTPKPPASRRAGLWTWLWLLGSWLAARRRPSASPEDVARHIYRHQTRGMALRTTEWLRDRLRPTWLRLRRP